MAKTIQAKAAVFDSNYPEHFNIQSFEIPSEVGDNEMLLRTEISCICGSDMHMFKGRFNCGKIVPGHEFVGQILSVGNNFRDAEGNILIPGDRIVPESTIPCGKCIYCIGSQSRYDKIVDYSACEMSILLGRISIENKLVLTGGFSEYVQLPQNARVHKIPSDIPSDEAAILEPLAVAVKAIRTAGIIPGDTVVIQGPGPIGLLCVITAYFAGATKVFLTGGTNDEIRLELGREFGAIVLTKPTIDQNLDKMLSITSGKKAERVIDATGSTKAFQEGIAMTSRGGVYVNIGGFAPEEFIPIYPDYLKRNKIDIRFSHTGANCYQMARNILLSKRFPVNKIISHRICLEDIELAMIQLMNRTYGEVKVAIDFT